MHYFDNYKSSDVFNLFFYHLVLISLKVNLHQTFRPQTKFKQESFPIVQIMVVNGLSSEIIFCVFLPFT